MLRKPVIGFMAVIVGVTAIASFHNIFLQYVCWAYLFPLLLSMLAGDRKGRWVLGFWLGVFLSWIGLIVMLVLPANQTAARQHALTTTHRECPYCKELMRRDATVCPHCQRDI